MGWLDLIDVMIDVSQSYRLYNLQQQLDAMQAGQLTEQFRLKIIESLKNIVFSIHQDLKTIQPNIALYPRQAYVISLVLNWRLSHFNITPDIFPSLSDKEYAQAVIQGVKEVKLQLERLLDHQLIATANDIAKEMIEIPQLNEWINSFVTWNKIKNLESELSKLQSTKRAKTILGIFFIVVGIIVPPLLSPAIYRAIYDNMGMMLFLGCTFWGLVGFGIYQLATRKKGPIRDLENQLAQLRNEMPDNERLAELKNIYSGLTYEDCLRLREEKIASIKSFMGEFKGLESINVLPGGINSN